jgi:nitrogen-specific signal transduction histidine kinase
MNELPELYVSLLNSLDSNILGIDLDYVIQICNNGAVDACKMMYNYDVCVGHSTIYDLFANSSKNELDKALNIWKNVINGKSETIREKYGDINSIWFKIVYSPMYNNNYDIIGVSLMCYDITKQVELEENNVELIETKDNFLVNMSHELRTPLNSILGFAQLLQLSVIDETNVTYISNIYKGGKYLLELINDMLDISRIEKGFLDIKIKEVKIYPIITEVIDMLKPLSDIDDISIILIENASLNNMKVSGDSKRIKQIFINIITNAIKYNKHSGTVTILCNIKPDKNIITIHDTGYGIEKDNISKIFKPFERMNYNPNIVGTGLGLSLSMHLIKAMNGNIICTSRINIGTKFVIELPLYTSSLSNIHQIEQVSDIIDNNNKYQEISDNINTNMIIYIEDNVENHKFIKTIVSLRPHIHLLQTTQGSIGLKYIELYNPRLVLLDLHIRDINGDDILIEIKNNLLHINTTVIMITSDLTQKDRLITLGAEKYIVKPIDVQELLDILDIYVPSK